MIQWKAVIRGVVLIFMLTAFGGFLIGSAVPGQQPEGKDVALVSVIFAAVGFTISGCLIRVNRGVHLIVVGLITWLLTAVNMLFPGFGFREWFLSFFAFALALFIGWCVSYVLMGVWDGTWGRRYPRF